MSTRSSTAAARRGAVRRRRRWSSRTGARAPLATTTRTCTRTIRTSPIRGSTTRRATRTTTTTKAPATGRSTPQLHSLAEAEQFIKAGIPLVASIAFEPNKLDGFLFRGTDGHLLVIGGFTADGNVISYDPASSSDATVRHVYDRAQLEKAWMAATGGIVYVIHPASVALPPSPLGNW